MINDAEDGHPLNNCSMKLVIVDQGPRLCIFATRDIKKGEELRYDYGVPSLPWRKVINFLLIIVVFIHQNGKS